MSRNTIIGVPDHAIGIVYAYRTVTPASAQRPEHERQTFGRCAYLHAASRTGVADLRGATSPVPTFQAELWTAIGYRYNRCATATVSYGTR